MLTEKIFKLETAMRNEKKKARWIYSEPKEGQRPLELETFLQEIFESRFLGDKPIHLTLLLRLSQDLGIWGLYWEPCMI